MRRPRQVPLTTREARSRLSAQAKPYWRELSRGRHIGYYKGTRATRWYLREFVEGRYVERTVGKPDDVEPANGKDILSWEQVQRVVLGTNVDALPVVRSGYTVADAMEDYFASRAANSKSEYSLKTDRAKMKAAVLPKFGARQVMYLHTDELQTWLSDQVADAMAKLKTKDKAERAERQRRAQATAHRTWNIFRAILNHAKRTKRLQNDAWLYVQSFKNIDQPRTRYLSVEESRRLLNACTPDFRFIAQGALLTGMRYGELCKLKVADVVDGTVFIRASGAKNSRARSIPLTEEGAAFFQQVCAGKRGSDFVFTRADGEQWNNQHQKRRILEACEAGKIDPPCTFHDLRRSYGSQLINSGMPLHMISRLLGHATVEQTRKAYALTEDQTLRDELQRAAPVLGLAVASTVRPITTARGAKKGK